MSHRKARGAPEFVRFSRWLKWFIPVGANVPEPEAPWDAQGKHARKTLTKVLGNRRQGITGETGGDQKGEVAAQVLRPYEDVGVLGERRHGYRGRLRVLECLGSGESQGQ